MSFTYRGLKATLERHVITDAEIDQQMEQIRQQNVQTVHVDDRPTQNGDEVVLDYAGFCDGVQFPGGTAENQTLVLGSGMFIPGFEEQLLGKVPGDEVLVKVTFPTEYHAANLAGKDAEFRCKIYAVRVKQMRDLDGEVAFYQAIAKELAGDSTVKNPEAKIARANKKAEAFAARKEKLQPEHQRLTQQLKGNEDAINALRAKYAGNQKFAEYEAMRDNGIDLSRLKYKEMRVLRKDIQIIFQDPYSSLNPRMTIGQIIGEGLTTHKFFKPGSAQMKAYILKVMEQCGLQDYMLHRYPHQFSGGQRQRICIARALAVKPKFIVCDECVSALDVSIQSQIINLLEELKEKENLTYLFISHDLSVVRYISDRIGVMYLGNMVELGDAETIFADPRHPYTVALLSSIPTTDAEALKKERILLEGNIPSPIRPPEGCKFHTRCYMACDKCKRVPPPYVEVEPGHFVACHQLDRKIDENGNYLFELPKMERRSNRAE